MSTIKATASLPTSHASAGSGVEGYAVILRSQKDGHEFLAHGGNGLPWFTAQWKHAQNYRRELLRHNLHGKVVKAIGCVQLLQNS